MNTTHQPHTYQPSSILAILGAFGAEVQLLRQALQNAQEVLVQGVCFYTGTLHGRAVVVGQTGIGKVNAAVTTALMVHTFEPKQLIFTGIAGGINDSLHPGDIVIGQQVGHHDYHAITFQGVPTRQTYNFLSNELNPDFFPADAALLQKALEASQAVVFQPVGEHIPVCVVGTIVSGDLFVSSTEKVNQLRDAFGADATEMEGAAVAQVCHQWGVPHLVIRSVSDRADAQATEIMFSNLDIAAQNSAKLTLKIIEIL